MLPQKLSLERLGRGYLNLKEALKRGEDSIVFYSAQNARYHLASQAGRFFLYVTPDRLQAKSAVEILNDYLGEEVVLIPEKDDLLINATVNLSGSVAERRSFSAQMARAFSSSSSVCVPTNISRG